MAVEPAWAVQMKQELAGLPLNEQQERLRPERPVQLRSASRESASDDYGSRTGCHREEVQSDIWEENQNDGKTVIVIKVHRCEAPPLVGDKVLVDKEHVFTVVSLEQKEHLWCTAEAEGYIDMEGEEVEFLDRDNGTEEENTEERDEDETEEGTRSGSVEEGEEQTNRTGDVDSDPEKAQEKQTIEEIKRSERTKTTSIS